MAKGGKRAGAGRKPSTIKGIAKRLPADSAALILTEIRANQRWVELANSEDERIRLDTLKYLTDRAHGKAPQSIDLGNKDNVPFRVLVEHIGNKDQASAKAV